MMPPKLAGAGSGVYNTTRQIGAVLGSAGIAALMSGQTKLTVGVDLLGLPLGGLLGVVTGLATSLVNPLTQAVVGTLATRLFALVGSLGMTLTTTL
ncbi:MFS transporter, partial [Bacillus sp. S34]|nr:MFS transporter [Bacillus sp. S34]